MTELMFRLSEATEHLSLMAWELAAAKRLSRHLEEDRRRSLIAAPCQHQCIGGKDKKPKQAVVCKRCEAPGHH